MADLDRSRTPDILATRGADVTRVLRGMISAADDRCNVVRIKGNGDDDKSRFAKHLLKEALFYYDNPVILFANVAGDGTGHEVFCHLLTDLGTARDWSWEQPQNVPKEIAGDRQATAPAPAARLANMVKHIPLIGGSLKQQMRGGGQGSKADPFESSHVLFRRLRQIAAGRDVVLVLDNAHNLPIIHAANVAQVARTLPAKMRVILLTASDATGVAQAAAQQYESVHGAVVDLTIPPAVSAPPPLAEDLGTQSVGRMQVHVKEGGVMLGAFTRDRRPDQAMNGLVNA